MATVNPRVLVYGFAPYGGAPSNVSEDVVRALRRRPYLTTVVLPVEFKRGVFLSALRRSRPDLVLGLGEHPSARRIRIERRAANLIRAKGIPSAVVLRGGPRYLLVPTKLKATRECRSSYDAGRYVCNFSMCIFADACKRRGAGYAFVHLPRGYNVDRARTFVEAKVDEMVKRWKLDKRLRVQ